MKVSKQLKDRFRRRVKKAENVDFCFPRIEALCYEYYLYGASDYQDIIQGKEAQDEVRE